VSILFVGTTVAQALTVAASPFLSRLYTPEQFGGLGFIVSIISIFTVIANLRFELVIALPKFIRISQTILLLVFFINSIFVLVLGGLLYFTKDYFSLIFNFELELKYIFAIIALVFLNSNFNAITYFNAWAKEFKTNSLSNVIRSLFTNIFQVMFGVLSPSIFGLLFGQILGRVFAIYYFISKGLRAKLFTSISISKRKTSYVLKKYKSFPLLSTPQAFINSLSLNSPIFILGYFFSAPIVGFYWFSERLLKIPINFLSSSVRQVFLQKASNDFNNKLPVFAQYKNVTFFLFLLGVVPVIILFIYGAPMFAFIFGEEWATAGSYSAWIGIAWFGILLNSPSVVLIQIYDFQRFYLFYESLLSIFKVIALIIGGLVNNPLISISYYSLVTVIFNVLLIIIVGTKVKALEKIE
jgi:O-antigen/teichoic acid export membrane protein